MTVDLAHLEPCRVTAVLAIQDRADRRRTCQIPKASWGEELRALLSQAVKRRLISDVPLGIFLSGGMDSSAVLAFADRHVPAEQLKTFSIGFHEKVVRRIALCASAWRHSSTATIATRFLSLDKASELIPDVLSRLDEPMGDSSILPTYLLCRFARQRVTVALGGDGGDEMFAGYDPFKALNLAKWYRAPCAATGCIVASGHLPN